MAERSHGSTSESRCGRMARNPMDAVATPSRATGERKMSAADDQEGHGETIAIVRH
jgi:hypothetical protein